jgi:glyoxylase-like metal-dependent hydrolase (beta-lactamase superfamily II)
MARYALRFPENAPGEFFVEQACIDCDVCRQVAPQVFGERPQGESFVVRQPVTEAERRRALLALVACPTSAIGTHPRADASAAIDAFPEVVEGEVSWCGFTSPDSFGAHAYLIERPGGNVLVDSPRAAAPLVQRLSERGGIRFMFLSHRDDVADHQKFRERFGCERILHARDAVGRLQNVEAILSGDEPIALAEDLLALPVPGHTAGSMALLYRERFLFTGDHLWWSEARRGLVASRSVCWYSWAEQVRSLEKLRTFRFEWVLPGHGRRFHAASAEAMRGELDSLLRSIGAPGTASGLRRE